MTLTIGSIFNFLENTVNWISQNPWWALGIAIAITLPVFLLAGGPGLLAAEALAGNLWYLALSLGIAGAVIAGIANFGFGGGPDGTTKNPPVRDVSAIIVSGSEAGKLKVEVRYGTGSPPTSETWLKNNINKQIENVSGKIPIKGTGDPTIQVQFLDVPEQLRYLVIEQFRLQDVRLMEEVPAK